MLRSSRDRVTGRFNSDVDSLAVQVWHPLLVAAAVVIYGLIIIALWVRP